MAKGTLGLWWREERDGGGELRLWLGFRTGRKRSWVGKTGGVKYPPRWYLTGHCKNSDV